MMKKNCTFPILMGSYIFRLISIYAVVIFFFSCKSNKNNPNKSNNEGYSDTESSMDDEDGVGTSNNFQSGTEEDLEEGEDEGEIEDIKTNDRLSSGAKETNESKIGERDDYDFQEDEEGEKDKKYSNRTIQEDNKFAVSVDEEDSKIFLSDESEGKELSTVKGLQLKGVSILPGEYQKQINCEYENRVEKLDKIGSDHFENVLSSTQFPGQLVFTAEKGEAVIYKVENYHLKKITNPRSMHYINTIATRAVLASQKKGEFLKRRDIYKSVAVLTFLRDNPSQVNPYKPAELKINLKGAGKMPRFHTKPKTWDDDTHTKEKFPDMPEGITKENTFVELVKVYVVKTEPGISTPFPIKKGMQEVSVSAFLGYDSTIRDKDENIEQPGDAKVYIELLARYDWVGPLGNLTDDDYIIGGNEKSNTLTFGQRVKKEVDKKFKNDMLFASKTHIDLKKGNHHDFIFDDGVDCNKPIAEYTTFWRLILGGVCVGVVSPEPSSNEIFKRVIGWYDIKRYFNKNKRPSPQK